MLNLNNVEVTYHNVILVLRGVSLSVDQGQIITILGANGAGKSTVLKAISGLLKTEVGKVSDGSIDFNGRRIDRLDPEEIAKMGILQILEGRQALEHLSIEENLKLGAYVLGGKGLKKDLETVYSYFPRLLDIRNNTSGYCSGGEQQQMVIGRALMAHPKLMLLDEPSLGLAPLLVREIFDIVKVINEQEKTSILIVEQNVRVAIAIADYGYVMENGRIVMDGTAEKLSDNEDIREFYMGLSKVGEKKDYREIKHYKRRKRWL